MARNRWVIVLFAIATTVLAQDQPPTGGRPTRGRVQTTTRLVSKYMQAENKLFQALQGDNRAGLEKLLAPGFEAWTAEKTSPTPRDAWMQVFLGNLKSFRIRNMAVHDYGDLAVVSFLLDRSGAQNRKPMTPVLFVVDVWQHEKLAVRYASSPANPAPAEDKPTGKE